MRIALVGAELEENLAIRYIWGALEAEGHEVVQVAFNRSEDLEEAAQALCSSGASLAGFSMVFTYRAREFAGLARHARALGFRGHLIAGGHFAAFNAEALLRDEPAFQSVALGEGERILCDLARNLDAPTRVRGLAWRAPDGTIVRNAPAEKPPDLDALPHPVRKQPFGEYLGLPIANMLSSRGCTHACAFCSISAWHRLCGGARFRLRAPEQVAQEMADLYARGVRIFNFHDDNFFLGSADQTRRRVERMADVWSRRGMGRIAFAVKSRPDSVDERLFEYLKSLGLFRVFLGIEAGTAEALQRLGRGQTLAENERALEIVNRLDLHACFNLLMLNPDSTLEDFRAHIAFLRAHPRNPMNFCRTEIYSGTPLEERLRRSGRLRGDYWGYGYHIADPRAQAAFELIYEGMPFRHYGEPNVQHMTMNVDYERQLLGHFFGPSTETHRRAKEFIVHVNLDTCDRLERIAAWVAAHPLEGAARRNFVEQLHRETAASNEWLLAEGRRVLRHIRRAVAPERSAGWGRRVAAAGLAAALAFSAPALTSAEEMAPEPPRQEGRAEDIREQVKSDLLPHIAARLEHACPLRVWLQVKPNGDLGRCAAWNAGTQTPVPALVPATVFAKAEARGKEFTLTFDEAETAASMRVRLSRTVPPVGEAKELSNRFMGDPLKQALGLSVVPERDVCLEIWVSEAGYIENVLLFEREVPSDVRELTAEEKERATAALRDMASDEFETREKAEKQLKSLGRAVLPVLREALASNQDVEVKMRCTNLARLLEGRMPGADQAALALSDLGAMTDAKTWGKRFRLQFTAAQLRSARRRAEQETHMCEMAPAPRD